MRYWRLDYQNMAGKDITRILSDDDIIAEYWNYWYGKMTAKFGKDYVDQNFSKSDCIDDWSVVNWAVQVMEVKR